MIAVVETYLLLNGYRLSDFSKWANLLVAAESMMTCWS
jgi:hypothetical protein